SPAQEAGIEVGDIITEADSHTLKGLSEAAASAFIKGKAGTSVTLRIVRGDKRLVKRVKRARISVPVVESKIANAGGKRAAYVHLSTFGPHTAHVEVAEAIKRLERRKAKGIVLDLRG